MPRKERAASQKPASASLEGTGGKGPTAPGSRAAAGTPAALRDEDVALYLAAHPDFLATHPDLLDHMRLPSRHDGARVVDLQQVMIERLRRDNQALVSARRAHNSALAQSHEAVLALLAACSFEHLIGIITTDLALLLDVDAVVLGVESASPDIRGRTTSGVLALDDGMVDFFVGEDRNIAFASGAAAEPMIFGGMTDLVRSTALIRLSFGYHAPGGLLALGARSAERFSTPQSAEPLLFLARALEHCVRAWLGLPD